MATTLADIRAKLQAQDNKQGAFSGDSSIYPHWNIAEGSTSRVRFLPDGDANNTFFWVERAMIRLPFSGIKGQADSKPVVVPVPCMEMYGKDYNCPILAEVRPWFKDPSLEDMGRKYWKKKSYLFQGFVRDNPLSEDKTPENPIRRFIISPQIFGLIRAALMDPEMENLPTDYSAGLDFVISKTTKGGFADYNTSKWSRKESSLTADEQQAIEKFGLFNLTEFLPKKPTDVELRVIKEMFEASVDGKPFDMASWGSYFKPPGMSNDSAAPPVPRAATPAAVADDDADDPAPARAAPAPAPAARVAETESAAPAGQTRRAEDILAMIRNRPAK
jgi:hypothetical protein